MNNNVNYTQPPFDRPPFGQRPPFGRGPDFGPPVGPPPFDDFQPPFDDFQQPYAVDPGAIRFCLFRFTSVVLINGDRFVMYPVFVGPTSVAGWQYTRRGWRFIGLDLRQIIYFSC